MAKLKMQCISIAVLNKDKKRLISRLQRAGAIELRHSKGIDGFDKADFSSQRLVFERVIQSTNQAIDILNEYAPAKKGKLDFLNGRREIDEECYEQTVAKTRQSVQNSYDIIALDKQMGECKAEISRLKIAMDRQMSWISLDVPTDFAGTKHTRAFIGSFNKQYLQSEIVELINECGYEGDYSLEIISSKNMQTNIFAICLDADAELFDSALRKAGFSYLSDESKLSPLDAIKSMKERSDALTRECIVLQNIIEDFAADRENIEFAADYYSMKADRYRVYGDLISSKSVTLIEGYIPSIKAQSLKEEIETEYVAAVEITEPTEEDDVPVALKNNAFNRPSESIVTMFSPPSASDVDPTSTMAFFFYLFFGMMLSDAGYGLLMVLGTIFVLKKFNLEQSMRNSMTMFFYCGVSTVFWGLIFGGFFGDLIPKFAETYFGVEVVVPSLINPINDALTLLVLGLALGVVHLFVGMGIKFISLCKSGHVLDAIFDVGFWYVTIVGMIMAVSTMFVDAGIIGTIGVALLGAGILGLVLTQGRSSKGFGKVISGVASIYDITSYASDILSYCRLMALGLATGVFAQVINQLGSMFTGAFGIIAFAAIFIIGNLISFAMNALGAYVHTMRLQYVEYFNKFYEGGGRMFEPFAPDTKYIRFKAQNAVKAAKKAKKSA